LSSGLTLKEKLERIDEIRSRINRAANLLSGHLDKLTTEASPENKEHIQRIKREIRTILNQLGRLGELCNKSSKNTIDKLSKIIAQYTMYRSIHTFYQKKGWIDLWATNALTTTTGLDIYKWPLEIKAGIRAKIGKWVDVYIKGKTKRPL